MTFEIFKLILDNTDVIASVVTVLVFLQGGLTAASEIVTFYRSIKTQSSYLKFVLSIIPSLFILTYSFISPLLFGSFLTGGIKPEAIGRIYLIATLPQFSLELLVVCSSFVLLAVLYCYIFRPRLFSAVFTFGLETAIIALLFVAVALQMDYNSIYIGNLAKDISTVFPLLIYGYFILLYKTFLTLTCVIVGISFKDRTGCSSITKEYFFEGGNYETAAIHFLTYRQKAVGCVSLFNSCFIFCLSISLFFDDMGLPMKLSNAQHLFRQGELLLPMLIVTLPILISINCLFFSCFPHLSPAFRKLKKHGLFPLFYKEVAEKHIPLTLRGTIETEHFKLRQIILIYWLKIKQL